MSFNKVGNCYTFRSHMSAPNQLITDASQYWHLVRIWSLHSRTCHTYWTMARSTRMLNSSLENANKDTVRMVAVRILPYINYFTMQNGGVYWQWFFKLHLFDITLPIPNCLRLLVNPASFFRPQRFWPKQFFLHFPVKLIFVCNQM